MVISSDGSGSKIFGPVNFLWLRSGRVRHLWFGFEFGKFSLKCQIFQFFSFRVKKNIFELALKVPGSKAGRPLIYCSSKVSSGRIRALSLVIRFNSKPIYLSFKLIITSSLFTVIISERCLKRQRRFKRLSM